jgi:hypothetical protein
MLRPVEAGPGLVEVPALPDPPSVSTCPGEVLPLPDPPSVSARPGVAERPTQNSIAKDTVVICIAGSPLYSFEGAYEARQINAQTYTLNILHSDCSSRKAGARFSFPSEGPGPIAQALRSASIA